MSREYHVPFSGKAPAFSWAAVGQLLGWLLPILASCGLIYLSSIFATHQDVKAAVQEFAPLPAKVQSLEEFRVRQEHAQEATSGKLDNLSTGQATLAAQQSNTDRKIDRILDQLERLNRRTNN